MDRPLIQTCCRCRQKGHWTEDTSGMFNKGLYFGEDGWAMQSEGDLWFCGSCRLDQLTPLQLADYGLVRRPGSNRAIYLQGHTKPIRNSQPIPTLYKNLDLTKMGTELLAMVQRWSTSENPFLALFDEATNGAVQTAWAIAIWIREQDRTYRVLLAQDIILNLRAEDTYRSNGVTRYIQELATFRGVLIILDIFGAQYRKGEAGWILDILRPRWEWARKTVIAVTGEIKTCDRHLYAMMLQSDVITYEPNKLPRAANF